MPSKGKEERLEQKAYWEGKLSQRLAQLKEDGVESGKTVKDTVVKQIRAKLRETNNRLETIDKMEKKIQEMAATKAEKLAAPKVKKSKKKTAEEEEESKRQQKKKKKKAKKEKKAEWFIKHPDIADYGELHFLGAIFWTKIAGRLKHPAKESQGLQTPL